TKSKRDWSSDVCSSDLGAEVGEIRIAAIGEGGGTLVHPGQILVPGPARGVVHSDATRQRHQQEGPGGPQGGDARRRVLQLDLGPLAGARVEGDQLAGTDPGADVEGVLDLGEAPGVVAAVVAGRSELADLTARQVEGV